MIDMIVSSGVCLKEGGRRTRLPNVGYTASFICYLISKKTILDKNNRKIHKFFI